jgi:enoyl-CoA hydratase/carnithine racemase
MGSEVMGFADAQPILQHPVDEGQRMRLPVATDKMAAEIDGPIGWISFNNPARRNAVSVEMLRAVPGIIDGLEQDAGVRVVVLRGAGEAAFVAGLDISQFEDAFASSQSAELGEVSGRANARIQACAKPTIAMIHGFCIGAGLQIAASCDLRIASDRASLSITAARLGLGYPVPALKRLLDLVGASAVKHIFFTGRSFSAAEAERMGLLDRVVPAPELETHVREFALALAGNAPLTIAAIKGSVEILQGPSPDFAACERLMAACLDSADYAEGRRAFAEKRSPVFTGR